MMSLGAIFALLVATVAASWCAGYALAWVAIKVLSII